MRGTSRYAPRGPVGRAVNGFEETFIALLLGLMTVLTFANVVLRKLSGWAWLRDAERATGFDVPDSIIWSLEVTLILFSWLVIFGVSYGFKITAHLGVDALTNILPPPVRRACALLAGGVCIVWALLMLKGAYDFWAPFAALERTSGRWLPTGFEETRDQAWYVTDQVPPLRWLLGWLEPLINQGEEYEQLPRVIPYLILPFGTLLILFRIGQAVLAVWQGERESLIVSHEAEDAVEEAAAKNRSEAAETATELYDGQSPPQRRA